MDTKGVHQQILNSYCNARMFKVGSKARIIIVVEYFSLMHARGGAFVEVASMLRDLFKDDFSHVLNSCLLVITKVHPKEISERDILEIIQETCSENHQLGIEGTMLVKNLL